MEKRRNYLISEPNYHPTKFLSKNLLATEMKKKKQILMNKLLYLGLSILETSKIVMHEFWYDYIKPKYNKKAKLCYMDTDSFIIYVQTEDIYEDIAKNVGKWFDTSK